jgi:hypothetical protein
VVIYADVSIGDRSLIHANAVIHERSIIGNDCLIHSGAVIGSEGFGFVPTAQGTWTKMPQAGRTVLGDRVEVGCNAAIDRGAIGDTYIGSGTKIDNLVQIGHGCTMGNDCLLAGSGGLGWGRKTGQKCNPGRTGGRNQSSDDWRSHHCWCPSRNCPECTRWDSQIQGTPAFGQKVWLKASALFRRLPEIYKMIKQMQRDIEEIKAAPKMTVKTAEELFEEGLARYKAGEELSEIIPIFKTVCDRQPKISSGWTCLSWLYLLDGKATLAYKAAQKAVKLNPEDPQARINLALAMLETGQKGVRIHVEAAQNWLMILEDLKPEDC